MSLVRCEVDPAHAGMIEIRVSCLQLAKYSQSPLEFFLEMPLSDLCGWIETVNNEIEAEEEAGEKQKKAKK